MYVLAKIKGWRQKLRSRQPRSFLFVNMLSKEAVLDYQKIYQETYGKEISYEKAMDGAMKLLRLFRLVYTPIPRDWQKKGIKNEKHK